MKQILMTLTLLAGFGMMNQVSAQHRLKKNDPASKAKVVKKVTPANTVSATMADDGNKFVLKKGTPMKLDAKKARELQTRKSVSNRSTGNTLKSTIEKKHVVCPAPKSRKISR